MLVFSTLYDVALEISYRGDETGVGLGTFVGSTKGLVFEDAPTTTLILRGLVRLLKRAPS